MLDRISNSDLEMGLYSCICHLLLHRWKPKLGTERRIDPLTVLRTLTEVCSAYKQHVSLDAVRQSRVNILVQDVKIPLRPSQPTRTVGGGSSCIAPFELLKGS